MVKRAIFLSVRCNCKRQKLRMRIIFSLLVLAIISTLSQAGRYLIVYEKPVKADVIIILSSGLDRMETGVGLYKRGFAPYILLSNGTEDQMYETALDMGVPQEAIIVEGQARSTIDNAKYSREIMEGKGFQSALVVSSNYHMRRVYNNFETAFKNSGYDLTYCAARDLNNYNPKTWWQSKSGWKATFTEYIKLVGNYFGIHGDDAKKFL